MERKITQQNSQMWRSLWLLLLVFMGGVYNASAIKKDEVLSGDDKRVYSLDKSQLLNNPNLSFKVITPTESKSQNGAVSVQASDKASFSSEALTIPSLIYVKENGTKYPYAVTTIPDNAFQGKTGITDLFFTPGTFNAYQITTIGNNAFEGAALTGTIQLPRTIKTIGDNAFALLSGTGTIADVVLGANSIDDNPTLNFGKSVFGNRTITNLHVLGNFSYATYTYSDNDQTFDQTFNSKNVTNLMYYGDGTTGKGDGTTGNNKGDGDKGYYKFLSTTLSESKYPGFKQFCKNLYLPGDDVKNFVTQCTEHNHDKWIPETVNCLTFETTKDGNTYTLMLKSSADGYELALHGADINDNITNLNLDFKNWDIDILPTTSNLNGHVVQIDSKAFAGKNNNLQSITITPYSSESCKIEGNAFQGLKSLQYLDLSNEKITMATGYSLSRIPTNAYDESVAYQYTKSNDEYQYELSELTPFGGLPAYTLVFMPKSVASYPSATQTEAVYKIDGATPTEWTRPLDENCMLYDGKSWYCNYFGVYDVPELILSTASDPSCSWYSWSTPNDFSVKKKSTFYRDFKAGVPSSVCLPFAPDPTKDATFYTFKSTDGSSVTLTSVNEPAANTPYFIRPTDKTWLTSTKEQPISKSATINNTDYMHGVYTGQSMADASNAYGMTATDFKFNGITYPAGTFMKLSNNAYINPFRAYLTLSSSEAKILRLVISDTPTAIERTTLQEDNTTPYYNLKGMKTPHPTHGIYIHNGRKVIVK